MDTGNSRNVNGLINNAMKYRLILAELMMMIILFAFIGLVAYFVTPLILLLLLFIKFNTDRWWKHEK